MSLECADEFDAAILGRLTEQAFDRGPGRVDPPA
jgi:hypothetical protein